MNSDDPRDCTVFVLSPFMDEEEVIRMLAEAEKEGSPEFRLVASPDGVQHLIEAVRACLEVERALATPTTTHIEFVLAGGRVKDIVVKDEHGPAAAADLDSLVQRERFQNVSITTHAGSVTRVTTRTHRRLR